MIRAFRLIIAVFRAPPGVPLRAAPRAALAAAIALITGCGDNGGPRGLTPQQLVDRLQELPGVTVEEQETDEPDLHYYTLHFTQPIDHDNPGLGTFQQEVSLLHRNTSAEVPMVVQTSGYADTNLGHPVELTRLLAANQVAIEHRFFGTSIPDPVDWSKLTIAQMAADEHAIIVAMRSIYDGAFVSTGGSKGGMTAMYHRRFYPDDVDGTVAYVAPISFGAPDHRYPAYIDTVGPIGCRQAVRDIATEMLAHRRDAIVAHAQADASHTYTQISIGAAAEAAVVSLEWTFWQYHGADECGTVPLVSESDETVLAFLDKVSPVSDSDDWQVERFKPYYYQSYTQLGYPDGGAEYLAPYLKFTEADYSNELPVPEPPYDDSVMRDIDFYVEHAGVHLLFVYGEWDPWTGGKFALGNAEDAAILIQDGGTHSAWLTNLALSDRQEAFAKLEAWTGVTPMVSRVHHADLAADLPPRIPPVLARARAAAK
ncbi:MAG TPA: S28 family serine protease [Kofleriaceae bacterium]|nr:S28 family serine protease [Kofleriaceae bacterium]